MPRSIRSQLNAVALLMPLVTMAAPAWARWESSPFLATAVSESPSDGNFPVVVADGQGGMFVVWGDTRSGSTQPFVQHLDAHGDATMATNGAAVTAAPVTTSNLQLLPDGAGGVFVAWSASRGGTAGLDVVAQRLDASGARLWGPNGVDLCVANSDQTLNGICSDAAGGFVVVWEDLRNSATTGTDLYAQRVSAAGVPLWTTNGVVASTATNNQFSAQIVPDGLGGVVIGWLDLRASASSGQDITGQRLSSSGSPLWSANGFAVSNALTNQGPFTMVSDGQHGAIFVFMDARNAGTGLDIYMQHVSGGGSRLLGASDAAICTQSGSQVTPLASADGQGGVFLTWEDFRGANPAIAFAHMNGAGSAVTPADGVLLTNSAFTNTRAPYAIFADGFGGADVLWVDNRTGHNEHYGQRLTATGTVQWTADGTLLEGYVPASNTTAGCSDGSGGAEFAFHQTRSNTGNNTFAGRIDRYGFLGLTEPLITNVSDVKNDQGGRLKLTFDASYLEFDGIAAVTAYDIFRSVPAALLAQRVAGGARLTRDAADVAADPARVLLTPASAQGYAFELLGSISALDLPSYSFIVSTLGDSIAGSNPPTVVMVQARGGTRYWSSKPDSGHSVDNLAPVAPAPFTGQFALSQTKLHWNRNSEADLAGYRLYRGTTPAFVTNSASLVAALPDTGYTDATFQPFLYKLTAVDVHGNESPVASLTPQGVLGVDGGTSSRRLALARPAPSPALGTTKLAFTLAEPGVVTLALYDASGRRVRSVATGTLAAGEHAYALALTDDAGQALAAGLYFARLVTAGGTLTQRLVILHD